MKKYSKQVIKRKIHFGKSFLESWRTIKSNSSNNGDHQNDIDLKNNNDAYFDSKPSLQELLTDTNNITYQKIDYSKYEEISTDSLNCHNLYDCFHGIISYIFIYSNNKFNVYELEIHYSGARKRENLSKMKKKSVYNQFDIMNIFDYENYENEFVIDNYWNAYFGISFKRIKINPISYSIRVGSVMNSLNLLSFVFEGFNDEENKWEVLDERENINSFSYKGGFVMFFNRRTDKYYSSFKLKQTSPGFNSWGFSIAAFDIHGKISYLNENDNVIVSASENECMEKNELTLDFSYDPHVNMSEFLF